MYNEEALKSNYKYNMLFNSISNSNNSDEDANFNTNIISDFDLQNFDPKRYEYYTNLLKVFNNDPETLYNVLNKYNSIKSLKVKEKKIIREINDYVNKLNDIKPAQTGGGDNVDLSKIRKRANKLLTEANKLLTEADKLLGKSKELQLNSTFIDAIGAFITAIGYFKDNLLTEDKHEIMNTRLTDMFDNAINTLSEAVEAEAYRDDEEEQAAQAGGVSLINLLKEVPTTGPAGPVDAVKGTQANSKKKAQDRETLISTAEKFVLTAKKIVEDTKIALKNIEEKNSEDIKRFQKAILGELNTDYKGKIEADNRANAIKEKIKSVIKKDRGIIKSVEAFNDVVVETDGIAKNLSDYEFRDHNEPVDAVSADGTGALATGIGVAGVAALSVGTDTIGQPPTVGSDTDTTTTGVAATGVAATGVAAAGVADGTGADNTGQVRTDTNGRSLADGILSIVDKEVSNPVTQTLPATIVAEPSPTTIEAVQPPTLLTPPLLKAPPVQPMNSQGRGLYLRPPMDNMDNMDNMNNLQQRLRDFQGAQGQAASAAFAAQGQGLQNQISTQVGSLQGTQANLMAQGQGLQNQVMDLQGVALAAPRAFAAQGQAALVARGQGLQDKAQNTASAAALAVGGPFGYLALNAAKSLTPPQAIPHQFTRAQSAKFGGRQQGGDDLNDDTLKARYLETRPQRYSKIINDEKTIKRFKDKQIENNRNIEIKTNNKIEQLANDIDVYNALSFEEKKDSQKNKEIIQKIKNFENDPKNPLEELALTFDDRIVFIIATFFIRYVTIIMVQWCIDINIIKSFYEGFIYYAIIYIILFWFIVLFINIDNSFDVKYMNFNGIINSIRTLFYYFYMGTNGISRLLIHTSLILILIVIPIILNIKKKPTFDDGDSQDESMKILDYEERKQLSKSLSLFTMFIWLFTSIIATKF